MQRVRTLPRSGIGTVHRTIQDVARDLLSTKAEFVLCMKDVFADYVRTQRALWTPTCTPSTIYIFSHDAAQDGPVWSQLILDTESDSEHLVLRPAPRDNVMLPLLKDVRPDQYNAMIMPLLLHMVIGSEADQGLPDTELVYETILSVSDGSEQGCIATDSVFCTMAGLSVHLRYAGHGDYSHSTGVCETSLSAAVLVLDKIVMDLDSIFKTASLPVWPVHFCTGYKSIRPQSTASALADSIREMYIRVDQLLAESHTMEHKNTAYYISTADDMPAETPAVVRPSSPLRKATPSQKGCTVC
jgi:hypothetical protein